MKTIFRKIFRGRVTEEEIQNLIEEGEQEGVIGSDEHAMIDAVLDMEDTRVREIMVPRTDMVALEIETGIDGVLETIIDAGHSRIPVYEGDVDHIVGILYAKDLLKVWGSPPGSVAIGEHLRPAYFIPETKSISDLLTEFKLRRVHIAVAVDEYGGTSGLITIEDILEEIVGEIQDEFDSEGIEKEFTRTDDGQYMYDARSHIEDFEEEMGVELPRGDYETLGGFISHILGHVPRAGEETRFGSLNFKVVDADARKVSRIKVNVVDEGEH